MFMGMMALPTLDVPHEELVRYRRHFHSHPELSMQEFETAAFIAAELRPCGFDEVRTGIGKTGILATLKGGRPGPVTLLRADMDALPIHEVADVVYKSTSEFAMHACGHDGHMAILLACARSLAARRDEVAGTIVFCFQPGEEGSHGNKLMINDGALENPHVDRVFALHLFSGLDLGRVGIRDGAFFACSDRFTVRIIGKGGHGGMPDLAIDPIVAAAHVVTMLQTIVAREVAPRDPVVVTVGRIESGTAFNVIPDVAHLMGTVRVLDEGIRASMPERLERIVKGICDALRVKYEFEYHYGYPPTVNSPEMNDVVRAVARRVLDHEEVVDPHDIVMWSEDMAYMQQERPGAYFIVGTRGPHLGGAPQHSPRYDIDERSLDIGYAMMTGLALIG